MYLPTVSLYKHKSLTFNVTKLTHSHMPHSHHSHSGQFCLHAAQGTTLEQVVQEAIKKGFKTYGLTEHCPRYRQQDLYPEESDLTPDDLLTTFTSFLREAVRLKSAYKDQIDLLIGLETDYISERDLVGLKELQLGPTGQEGLGLETAIEYFVGSVHHVGEIPIDFDKPTYERAVAAFSKDEQVAVTEITKDNWQSPEILQRLTSFYNAYFDAQLELFQRFAPDVIGHFDLCRLYTPWIRLDDWRLEGVWERVERNVKAVIEYDGLFELNAASFRKGWQEAYPAAEVLQLIAQLGGRFCLSDDSHGPQAVGLNYGRLRDYLVANKVENIWYLASRPDAEETQEEPMGRFGTLVARKMPANWAEDAFWKTV